MTDLFEPLRFARGPSMKNRFMLAPLTNCQSHADGTLSDGEFHWLTMRAKGGFGLTMTCAAHVQARGQGFPGQLGIFSDAHLEGLTRLASAIKRESSLAVAQLHHAGMRSPAALIGTTPVCPSDNAETSARALTESEVEQLIEDFAAAAMRAQRAGFDGVEIHGAHGYVLCQFLSGEINKRTDRFGGSLENRARIVFDIIARIRERCRADFNVGLRLSPERFGLKLGEMREVAQRLLREGAIDYLDMSLWDVFKEPEEEKGSGRTLLSHFTDLDRGAVRLGCAGKINSGQAAQRALAEGADFVVVGRAAILHHDFPMRVRREPAFVPVALPVSADYLRAEGLSDPFVTYMRNWKGFVTEEAA
ncbi:MAG: NADH:flavin oxidoreductase [Alphaproteobacteria bacterium]|jgi:2,4-dienoyl-CoA reductase-like NADH-dependent reductase (Old Yellow Enzyme family)|nr:NADH:flavin oxidoreductase [Alphaproteobacteria bacterium]